MVKKNVVWVVLGLSLWGCAAFAQTPTPVSTETPTVGIRQASSPFTAVDQQGRPMIGASVEITDTMGNPVLACLDAACTAVQTQINSTGVFQFYALAGTYNVTITNFGVQRNFVMNMPCGGGGGGGGGGGLTSLNGLTFPDLVLQTTTTGNNFTISEPDPEHIDFNMPYASNTTSGLLSDAGQSIGGVKTFVSQGFFLNALTVNSSFNSAGNFKAVTTGDSCAFFVDALHDQVDVGSCDESVLNAKFVAVAPGTDSAIEGIASSGGTGVTGVTGNGGGWGLTGISGNGTGGGLLATGSHSAKAASFTRAFAGAATVPVVQIQRGDIADTTALLSLVDSAAGVASTWIVEYLLNGTREWAITPGGQFASAITALPAYSFIGDLTSGLEGSGSGTINLIASGTTVIGMTSAGAQLHGVTTLVNPGGSGTGLTIVNGASGPAIFVNSGNFVVTNAGEVTFAGVGSDGTGKALCVKADKNIGTCTDAVDGSGLCSCA